MPPDATACPECGADDRTGWSDRAAAQRLGLPDDEFDYDEFVKEEFGGGVADKIKPRGLSWVWWVAAVLLLAALLAMWTRFGGW